MPVNDMKAIIRNSCFFLITIILILGLNTLSWERNSVRASECSDLLLEADRLYLENNRVGAEQLYRQCKQPFSQQDISTYFPEPITNASQLSPGGQVYWREAQEGLARDQANRVFTALNLLTEEHPAFMPAYSALAEVLQRFGRESEALETLEQASILFPYDSGIARARVVGLRNSGLMLEASMAARLFAIINPDHPEYEDFIKIANEDLDAFKADIKGQYLTTGAIGILGNIFFGGGSTVSNILDSAGLAALLFEGEKDTGTRLAAAALEEAQVNGALVDDPVILEYVDEIGQDVAAQMGRDEFDYEFHVIADNSPNALAMPGGKVFVSTGAILAANTEAEFAGLLGHQVAHTVLSHSYQQLATDVLLSLASQALPIGNLANLASLGFSDDNEQQADILATRAIAGFGYAADGLRNFLVTLNTHSDAGLPQYLSTHPSPPARIAYLEALIQQNGYNRYSYEGIERHARIQQRIRELPVA